MPRVEKSQISQPELVRVSMLSWVTQNSDASTPSAQVGGLEAAKETGLRKVVLEGCVVEF